MSNRSQKNHLLFPPPALRPLSDTLSIYSYDTLAWISDKHVTYLDDKIHRIDELTGYLAGCEQVEAQRNEFVEFVDSWTQKHSPDLFEYLSLYSTRYWNIRTQVENLCDRIIAQGNIWTSNSNIRNFWSEFALINEIDSLHGMFLTSGRWYVNVMLPAIKELIFCVCRHTYSGSDSQLEELSYVTARRIITPCFAGEASPESAQLEKAFIHRFLPLLTHYDREILFLFSHLAPYRDQYKSLSSLVKDVHRNPDRFNVFLEQGVYPPFAWNELVGSRTSKKTMTRLDEVEEQFMVDLDPDCVTRACSALEVLSILKRYELNYNNYNYKGRFGIVSKGFYLQTLELFPEKDKVEFERAVLLDCFFEALQIVKNAIKD